MSSFLSSLLNPSPEDLQEVKDLLQFLTDYLSFHSSSKENAFIYPEIELVRIPGGTFWMGCKDEEGGFYDETPRHLVQVPSFYIGKYLVTQAQWSKVVTLPKVNNELPSNPSKFKGDNLPVENVTWNEAVEFCNRLSQYTGYTYRLPSEAEWEYACRAGTETPFHFGETITSDLVNYHGNSPYGQAPKGTWRQKTTPVGSFPPNRYGLYDMHGNVWEWCEDHWHETYEGAPSDGSAWLSSDERKKRLVRGGSWYSLARNCRCARRSRADFPSKNTIGFRVVVECGQ